jgi:cytochrome c oxidase subunit 2
MQIQSALDAASLQARSIEHLWWWMFGVGGAIWLAVIAAMFFALRAARGRRGSDDLQHVPAESHKGLERVVSGAVIITVLVLTAFLVADYGVGRALAAHPSRALTIEVIGHQWWWEVQYDDTNPSRRLVTANEIHIPTGEQVQLKLSAADVIHSFWVPNLQGKRDLIPGYTTTHWIKADKPGTYRGQCAEFCGLQHAKMALHVVAESPAQFRAWFAQASTPNNPPSDSTSLYGQRVFLTAGCSVCHTIGGTTAQATIGPSLTHFKSRATIAAGTLANTRENVEGWIANPQAIKPGTRMPAVPLKPAELTALVSYLETLK